MIQSEGGPTLLLEGCAPAPLAHYLKALGALRLVAEQGDADVRGRWADGGFVLETRLDAHDLIEFFLHEFRPSPIVAPWNKGSGFYPWDNRAAIEAVEAGRAARLASYRQVIQEAREVLSGLGILEAEQTRAYDAASTKARQGAIKAPIAAALDGRKDDVLQGCRARLAESAIEWFDAAVVLTDERPAFPPLLGTGGNDGRLDFTNNFMQCLGDVFDTDSGQPTAMSEQWLRSALYGDPVPGLKNQAIGQFFPSAAGGFNAGVGFEGSRSVNPWDFILMIEGALLFAAATVRRLESADPGALAFPFAVRQTGAGYGTSSGADEQASRPEMWLPLWSRDASVPELRALMSEGRARVGRRNARNGADFARALASLGVDRGIDAFQRYGFLKRFGRNYLATPLARVRVTRRSEVDRLLPIDRWLERYLRRAKAKEAPSSIARVGRRLEAAVIELASQGGSRALLELLLALGEAEEGMARSLRWASGRDGVSPLPPLDPSWLSAVDDGSVELRLAAALASVTGRYGEGRADRWIPLRANLVPVELFPRKDGAGRGARWKREDDSDRVPPGSGTIDRINGILRRRLLVARQLGHGTYPDRGRGLASLEDITAFIEGRVDDHRLGRLLQGLVLLDWPEASASDVPLKPPGEGIRPTAGYALLKLCFPGRAVRGQDVHLAPEIHARAASGDTRALRMASARLRASGLPTAVDHVWIAGEQLERTAASILFPLSSSDQNWPERVLRPEPLEP